jgi:AcrR family transcriptional regulator
MGSVERREREKKALRAKILDAARELFVNEGFEAVTMRRIAEKIEYSPTAIYLHFPDKDALVRELCENDFVAFAQNFVKVMSVDDPIERLRRAAHVYVEFAVEHPGQYRFMFMAKRDETLKPEEMKIDHTNPEQNAYAFLQGLVAEAYARGLVRADLTDQELVCQLLWAAVHGVAALQITKAQEEWIEFRAPKATVDAMVDALVNGIMDPSKVKPKKKKGAR